MTNTDWDEIVTTSHFDAVTKIKGLLEEQEYEEAYYGIETLQDIMARSERKAMASQLRRLMLHILKWHYQPNKRSTSWVRSISDARTEIKELQEYMPSLNESYISGIWNDCWQTAIEGAKAEMNIPRKEMFMPKPVTWQEIFEDEYLLENND
jgi:Domain of unknown function DUF29